MTTTDLDLTGFYADSTESGLVVTHDTLLTGDISEGVVYINQAKVTVSAVTGHAFTLSKDTYVDVGDNGVITYTETVIDAGAPALAADAVRLAKVVTDATTITSIVDMRTITDHTTTVFGLVDIGAESAMEIYNDCGTTVMIRFGSGSTSAGMPLEPYTSRDVTESVYARPLNTDGASLLVTK